VGVVGCRSEAERRLAGSVRKELERGSAAASDWVAKSTDSNEAAIATGYLERLRLGLGSPFRLIDIAQHDPRLADSTKTELSWALLARTLSGNTYAIEPIVLDRAGTVGGRFLAGAGRTHLKLIEKKLESADSVRAAELGLRIGYMLAASERLVSSDAPQLVGSVAALLTDRELAQRDAERFLQAVSTDRDNALGRLVAWRKERAFAVEQPRTGAASAEVEIEAINIAHEVLAELREWGLEVAAHGVGTREEQNGASLLKSGALERLTAAEAQLDMPPVTPIVIAARQFSREVANMRWLSESERRLRANFGTAAQTEEAFIAERARLHVESAHDAGPARVALQAAVALRAYAQESIWFPGMPAPAAGELEKSYGLAEVTFDRTVPARWRPYYRRMLVSSLDDLYRVMPALRLTGLRVHFGPTPEGTEALAIHDPRVRELLLPPATAAGTLAHELAHDIDWQMSVRRYRVRGDYATDRSTRSADGLSAQVRNLASASLTAPSSEAMLSAHARRPAEIFARGVDWYVAVSLAREGRRNGYLSSVQDELLTGYGTVRPPDVSGTAGDALMSILAELAPVYREQRDAFRALYGTGRAPRAYDLVRVVTEVSAQNAGLPTFVGELQALQARRAGALSAVNGAACGIADINVDLRTARRDLVLTAATANARGIALRYGTLWLGQPGRDLLFRAFYGGLAAQNVDSLTAQSVSDMITSIQETTKPEPPAESPFQLFQSTRCTKAQPIF
jgi:hypothetical protein